MGAQAFLLEDDREMASTWAAPYVHHNPAHKWVLGRFVEADKANRNRQLFTLDGLRMKNPTIAHAPMNMNHQASKIVGAYVASELLYPTGPVEDASEVVNCPLCGEPLASGQVEGEDPLCTKCGSDKKKMSAFLETAALDLNPYIEALAVFWRHQFPREYLAVEEAHAEGKLFYSMECMPSDVQCVGDGGCGKEFAYAGRVSDTYCSHINSMTSDKLLINPHFTAGALIIPPVNPGWTHADVHSLVAGHELMAQNLYDDVQQEFPHLSPKEWEGLMAELLVMAR